jgi:hypothetical protein
MLVEDSDLEATRVILETLFDIRGAVFDIHAALFGNGDDDEEATEDDA